MDMYGQVASAYGQELQNGVRLQAGLDQQAAQQPNTLFDRFMTAYQQKYLQRKAEAEMARKQQHEDTYMKMAQSADNSRVAETQNKWRDDVYNQWDGSEEQKKMLVDAGRSIGVANPEQYFDTSTKLEWNGAPMAPDSTLTKPERGGGGYLLKKRASELAEKKQAEANSMAGKSLEARLKMAEDARIAAEERQAALFAQQNSMADKRLEGTLAAIAARGNGGGMSANEYRALTYEQGQADKEAAAKRQIGSIRMHTDSIDEMVDELKNHPGLKYGTGLPGILTRRAPGSPTHDFDAKLEALKNQVGLEALKELRAASKTGGGVGNVSDNDIKLLKNSIDSLEATQSTEALLAALDKVKRRTAIIRQGLATMPGVSPGAPAPAPGGAPNVPVGTVRTSKRTGKSETWDGNAWR